MVLPNFMIPGASKSGTTSLHLYLKEHPEILMSTEKEPYFFCGPVTGKDLKKYETFFVDDKKSVHSIKAIGESSSVYIYSKNAPERIKELLGDNVRFIFLLRNPIERTISAYLHMYKRNADKRDIYEALYFKNTNWEKVIKEEEEKLNKAYKNKKVVLEKTRNLPDEPFQHFHYVRNSFYSIFIKEYLKYFPRENFLFIFTEELKEKPLETIKRIEQFLEVDDDFVPQNLGVMHNKTYVPNDSFISRLVSKVSPFVAKFINVSSPLIRKVYSSLAGSREYNNNKKVKNHLNKLFQAEKKMLGELIGRNVSEVWNYL